MDFGALCNFSGEKYHQEINIFKESEASRESVRELIRSLWGLGQPFITTYKLIGPIGLYGVHFCNPYCKGRENKEIKEFREFNEINEAGIPIATLKDPLRLIATYPKKSRKKLLPRCSISPFTAFIE